MRSRPGPSSSSACPTRSSIDQSSGAGRAAPASRRERSSRLPTRRSSRALSTRTVSSRPGSVGRVERERLAREAVDGDPDRGQRRAEIVADRAQHGRLDRVAPPQRLGVERLLPSALALRGDREQRGQRREEAAAGGEVRLGALADVERAHEASTRLQLERGLARRRLVARPELDPCAPLRRAPPRRRRPWPGAPPRASIRRGARSRSSRGAPSRARAALLRPRAGGRGRRGR